MQNTSKILSDILYRPSFPFGQGTESWMIWVFLIHTFFVSSLM